MRTPLLLVTTALPSMYDHPDPHTGAPVHENLGRLVQPRHVSSMAAMSAAGIPWAADNDCFQGLDQDAWVAMLEQIAGVAGCKFVTVPDVVRCAGCHEINAECTCTDRTVPIVYGDARATAESFERWAPAVARRGLPVGLVLQDGIDECSAWLERTWHRLDAVFVGGSTEFKLGPVARLLAQEAHARGKWVHWGRVNTRSRFDYIVSTGAADSWDGTKWARWRTTYLDAGLSWCREQETHLPLFEDAA
jgi:hypothetical protein